jgi:hypothetical protein
MENEKGEIVDLYVIPWQDLSTSYLCGHKQPEPFQLSTY